MRWGTHLVVKRLFWAGVLLLSLGLVLAACQEAGEGPGGGTVTTPTPTRTATPTVTATATGTPTGAATATPTGTPGGGGGETELEVEMGDNFFTGPDIQNGGTPGARTSMTAPAGRIRIEARNIGNAVHNIHIYDRQGGTSVAVTDPLAIPGGQSGTLTANLQPGTYFYVCDFHPTEMIGDLTVR